MNKTFCLSICLITFSAAADLPLFTISGLPAPAFNTTYSYTVTNNASYPLSNISLYYAPVGKTPPSFTQITSGANACGNYFSLAAGASCNLYYSINPTLLVDNLAVGGPEICYNSPHPIYCSVPDLNSQLDLSYTIPSVIVGGSGGPVSFAPYLLFNYKPGGAWVTGSTPVLPPLTSAQYISVDCNDSLCVTVGYTNNSPQYPLLVSTVDKGLTWQSTDLSAVTEAVFFSAACSPGIEGICVAGGHQQVPGSFHPVAYQYDYLTASWVAQTLPTPGNIYTTACADEYCALGGNKNNSTNPAIYYYNAGTWNVYAGNTPPDASNPTVNAISCEGSFCLAMGSQQISTLLNHFYSFMITSSDGIHWTTTDLRALGSFVLSDGINTATGALSCTTGLCVAGGINNLGEATLFQTHNQGATWTKVTSLGTLAAGAYNAVSCSPLICVALGYSGGNGQIMGQTVDGGNSWTHIPISLPSTVDMLTASCAESFCFITGYDTNTLAGYAYQTTDAGRTWKPIVFNPALASQVIFQGSYAR